MSTPESNLFIGPDTMPSEVMERIRALSKYIEYYLRRIPAEAKTANEMATILGIHRSHRLALSFILDQLVREKTLVALYDHERKNERWYAVPLEK